MYPADLTSSTLTLFVDGSAKASTRANITAFMHGENMPFSLFRRAGWSAGSNLAQYADATETFTGWWGD